ncbi:sensor histidine kinase [Actinoplanes flavus]|uniref:histidine kinase n=1 Tax=Actinoplanes flavus TaxID=2820290 RepID=A0ABS3UJP1_9ACTN|nr:histidine kinase [Actinoplanes flavus]MBO3738997.1 two-component sensor histidine kinase [Actinoplanes flavus]
MMNHTLFRLGQLTALGTLALLGILDVNGGIASSGLMYGLWRVAAAIAAAAVWLPAHRPDSVFLPRIATLLGLQSLLLTALLAGRSDYASIWGLAESAALLGVLMVVARRGRAVWAVPAVAVLLLAVAVVPLRSGDLGGFITFSLVQALAGAAAIGVGVYLRTLEGNRQRAVDAVRAEQRAEFARDLHDFIAHHVTGIVVQAQGARFVAEQDPQRVLLALEQIEQAGAETMASMRRMVGVLRDQRSRPDAPLAPVAGVPELAALVEQFTAAGGPVARLDVEGDVSGLPVEVSTSAYRVVMEALTNARQHAPGASSVAVQLTRTPKQLLVRVSNDGPAPRHPAPRDRPGYGLVGLAERVRAVGGRITAGPGIGGGWIVDAVLPLEWSVQQ